MSLHISVTEDLASCHLLRRIVFIEEQGVSEADELDDLDNSATHFLATENELPIGTARMRINGDTAKIGRVCVIKSHRGTGLGAALIRAAVEEARKMSGVTTVKLGAQTHALGFYEKLGFEAQGPVYDDAGIEHRDMVLTL
ncbi:MAG: GNAT family N-acetyltransferase [Sulfitobacter sp.]|jgi:predicted GNAT family N-acyltransferase|uniref:GNAT family N-acetyltransferase n=1 Tax=Sulfitobacter sp. TaxID=1903071 RepID=UPI000C0D82AE|nr:drug:proton antiporter [Roseobacter sp.]MBV49474.1 drug:proton antiporter [Roseobacter sp.]PHR09968.1 MAG: drug:proton antiporter [Sulfitobacter sp.]|tara:strand:- start:602 stop:1024 length:423 start_codon:yes stop_codon:yes gene_type:complete